jgi:hypothetical protein
MTNATDFDFDFAVLCYYKKHAAPCTAKQLAEYAGVSISRVRKAISDNKYNCDQTDVQIEVRERNYNTIMRHQRVAAFHPSRIQLLNAIIRVENKMRGVK